MEHMRLINPIAYDPVPALTEEQFRVFIREEVHKALADLGKDDLHAFAKKVMREIALQVRIQGGPR